MKISALSQIFLERYIGTSLYVLCCNLKPLSFQVSIPLLNIKNEEQKWFKLKGKSLSKLAKGDCPEILLEIKLFWNQFS